MKQSELHRLIRDLGHDPNDVSEVLVQPGLVSIRKVVRNGHGYIRVDVDGGPITTDVHHSIEEDGDLDVQAPPGAGP